MEPENYYSDGADEVLDQIIENKTIIVRDKRVKRITEDFAKAKSNYGVPLVVVRRVDDRGLLRLEHVRSDRVNLDLQYAEQVLRYVAAVWGRPVELIRKGKAKTWVLSYRQETGFSLDFEVEEYPENVEATDGASSY